MSKLPYRHPSRWIFSRYETYHRLLRMSPPSQTQTTAGTDIVTWSVGKGVRVGVRADIAALLSKHGEPNEDFGDAMTVLLLHKPDDAELNGCGIYHESFEPIADLRVAGMWQRHVQKQMRRKRKKH